MCNENYNDGILTFRFLPSSVSQHMGRITGTTTVYIKRRQARNHDLPASRGPAAIEEEGTGGGGNLGLFFYERSTMHVVQFRAADVDSFKYNPSLAHVCTKRGFRSVPSSCVGCKHSQSQSSLGHYSPPFIRPFKVNGRPRPKAFHHPARCNEKGLIVP